MKQNAVFVQCTCMFLCVLVQNRKCLTWGGRVTVGQSFQHHFYNSLSCYKVFAESLPCNSVPCSLQAVTKTRFKCMSTHTHVVLLVLSSPLDRKSIDDHIKPVQTLPWCLCKYRLTRILNIATKYHRLYLQESTEELN